MDVVQLRVILRGEFSRMTVAVTHSTIPQLCEDLGMPIPDSEMTKRDRLDWAISEVPDEELADIAGRFLEKCAPSPAVRMSLEDIIWADDCCPDISKRCRREVARVLDTVDLYTDVKGFDALLDSLWDLGSDPWADVFGRQPSGLRADIEQHVHKNPDDWPVETLFDKLGAFDAPNRRFAYFVEGLASGNVRPDEPAQRHFVDLVNKVLRSHAMELRETGNKDGYPAFSIVSMGDRAPGSPKNLIFASSRKPDLRLRDAINNDIEILSNPDEVLVYDRPIATSGLTWAQLQAWWSDREKIVDPEEAKKTLYKRLRTCLPLTSPPQMLVFTEFFATFGAEIPKLPALLPEVWLHWDPQTVKQRGAEALFRFRMDFLLLMPHNVRIVIEVDGKQHYADATGRADPDLYARTMAADRELKLAGYQVFRFGAAELLAPDAQSKLQAFFSALMKRYA